MVPIKRRHKCSADSSRISDIVELYCEKRMKDYEDQAEAKLILMGTRKEGQRM